MKDTIYLSVLDSLAVGFAHCRLLSDANGSLVGYTIIEENSAFELLTGLSSSAIGGKNIIKSARHLGEYGLDDLILFSKTAVSGEGTTKEKFIKKTNKWYEIRVLPAEKEQFIILISDLTDSKLDTVNKEELVNISNSLLNSDRKLPDLDKLTHDMCRIAGAEFGVFNLFSDDRKKFRNMAIYGNPGLISSAYKLLGFSLVNKEWDTSLVRFNTIKEEHIVRFSSLSELATGVIPDQLCKTVSAVLNTGSVYAIEIAAHSVVIGDFILLFRKGNELQNRSIISAFANMVGIAINRNNTENERKKSESNLKNFFNAGIDFHWVLNERGEIIEVNETVINRLGYKASELQGQPGMIVHPPEMREDARRIIESMLQGANIACNIPLRAKSGQLIPVETYVFKSEWNGQMAVFGISKDISELKLSEEKFSKAFNTSPDIMGISDLATGVYVEVNKAFCEILGFTQEEVIGKTSEEVLKFGVELRKSLLAKIKKAGFLRNEEVIINTKTGKPLNILLSAETITMAGKDYNLTVGVDITSRKAMEISLRQNEEKYRSLTEKMRDVLWTTDLNFNTTWVSPSIYTILGFTPEERIMQKAEDQVTPESLKYAFELLSEQLKNDKESDPDRTIALKMNYFHKEGSVRVLENMMSFIRDDSGNPVAIHGLSRDITERQKAEEELVRVNENLRQTGLMAKVGSWEADFVNGTLHWSDITKKIMSVPEDYIPQLREATIHYKEGDSRDRIFRLVENARTTGEPFDDEFIVNAFDGTERHIRNIAKPVFKDGICIRIIGTFQDITDKKIYENRLRKSEANLKAIIENTLENIWSVNTNYEVEYVNEVFSRAFFMTFGVELKAGMNIIHALPENLRAQWKERYDRAFLNEHFLFEDRIMVGGNIIYVEVAMNPIIVDGRIVGVALYGKDVTEKMISQLQLRYQADLRQLLVELSSGFINLPVGKIEPAISDSLEKIGEFVGADRSYVFEFDTINKSASNTIEWCRHGVEKQINRLQKIPLSKYTNWVEMLIRGESVKISNVNDIADPVLKDIALIQNVKSFLTIPLIMQGHCMGFVGFDSVSDFHEYTDIEHQLLLVYAQTLVNVMERMEKERKLVEAKEKAEESDRLKSAFLANMSHEIRTPMNGIIGFLNLLREPDLSDENKSAYIDIVTQSGQRLLDTLNDIIEISKIESKEMNLNISDVPTDKILEYFLNFFLPQASTKGIILKLSDHLRGGSAILKTDRNKLESMISNLLKNSVKFTSSGYIEFGNYTSDNTLVFYVKDTGSGIPENRLEAIFDRFVQGDISSNRPHEGSGLGLSIVRGYAELLNGNVWVESVYGKGSTFFFSLPYICGSDTEISKSAEDFNIPEGNASLSILIVEDDRSSYLYLERILSMEGYRTFCVSDGLEAVTQVKDNNNIGLVLMDIKLPGISGIEATKRIREFNKKIPIIAQTAYAFAGDREEAMIAGCSDYILKPVNRSELLKLIVKHTKPVDLA